MVKDVWDIDIVRFSVSVSVSPCMYVINSLPGRDQMLALAGGGNGEGPSPKSILTFTVRKSVENPWHCRQQCRCRVCYWMTGYMNALEAAAK